MGAGFASAVLGALVFAPALWSGRIADDYVLEQTLQGAKGLGWVFSHNDLGQQAGAGHFYRPLWVLWNLLLFGVSHSALLAHVGNLVLFAVLCFEVVALVWRLTRNRVTAWMAGALFAVFPSHGESVAWISGNTDLLAASLAMGCVLLALWPRAGWPRDVGVFLAACAAMLAKEIAFVLPLLLGLVIWEAPQDRSSSLRIQLRMRRWRPVASALGAAIVIFAVRAVVVGSAGGYGPEFTVKRLFGSALTFGLGTLSLPQLPLFRHPVYLSVPVGVGVAGLAITVRLFCSGDRQRGRLVLLGVGWFVIALLPVLNQPLDLNTRNGDRLLLIASVGFVIALCGLIELRSVWGRLVLGVLVVGCGMACVQNAFEWHAAGVESTRLITEVDRLATRPGSIIVLSFPTDLGEAHLFPDALGAAVQEHGRPGALVITCAPMHPLNLQSRQTQFVALRDGVWLGSTSPENPFAVGVLSASSVSAGSGCVTGKASHSPSVALGTALEAFAKPSVLAPPQNVLYFNGRDFQRAL